MDYSNLSTEELKKLIADSEAAHAENDKTEQPGLFQSLINAQKNYTKGALRGIGQGLGDFGASALNLPISGLERLTGSQLPRVPHPHLINENPESLSENIGQNVGHIGSEFLLPGGAGMKTAQLANRGYQAVRAGKDLPLIGKLLAAGAGGSAEGALGNEENRGLGAAFGAGAGAAGYAIPAAANFARSISSKNIANDVVRMLKLKKEHYGKQFQHILQSGEEAGANRYLNQQPANLSLLKRAGEGKNIYAIEKYNQNPTLTNAHDAQSDLGRIIRKYADSAEGTLERDAYEHALKLRNRLLEKISSSMTQAKVPDLVEHYGNTRSEYGKVVGLYLNSPTISKFNKKNPDIRASKVADKLLEEEKFMAHAGQNHPGLRRREVYNKVKNNKFAHGAALGLGGLILPYEIKKLLGM